MQLALNEYKEATKYDEMALVGPGQYKLWQRLVDNQCSYSYEAFCGDLCPDPHSSLLPPFTPDGDVQTKLMVDTAGESGNCWPSSYVFKLRKTWHAMDAVNIVDASDIDGL